MDNYSIADPVYGVPNCPGAEVSWCRNVPRALKSAQWCDRAIATSVENASCDYNYCYGVNV